ncbi:hypothetical protein Bca4012_017544 [Brassica carinata]
MELQHSRRSKTLSNGREKSKPIPIDLIMEILSRLPVKSIGRCCCVSKLWAPILRLPYFLELFSTRSSARPQILFAYGGKHQVSFLSSHQLPNPDENSPSCVAADHLSQVRFGGSFCHISGHVNGLVCITVRDKEPIQGPRKVIWTEHIICNPSTGQTLSLPKFVTMVGVTRAFKVVSFLWYDDIDKQFKVLSMEQHSYQNRQHHVLTLGTQKLEWRKIKSCEPHRSIHSGICINGVLYYPAVHGYTDTPVIVCFHLRSEEFNYIEVETTTFTEEVRQGHLINYNGKLGSLLSRGYGFADGASRSFELLVIGDFQKQEWSMHKYVLPPMWKNMVKESLRFVGFIGTNMIVLSRSSYVIYYNIEENTIVKVGIQGMEGFDPIFDFFTFLDYVEDLKLMQEFDDFFRT